MTQVDILLAIIVLAQQGLIYGLINRLLRQSGQHRLRPLEAISGASEAFTDSKRNDGKIEPAGKMIRESFKITP